MSETPESGAAEETIQLLAGPLEFLDKNVCLNTRTLYLAEISEDSAAHFIKGLHALCSLGDDDVHIILNSAGGNWFDGLAVYDAIRGCPANVTIEVLGKCMSMAVVIAQAGDQRLINENAVVMVHNGSQSFEGDAITLEAWGQHSGVERDRMYKILSRKSHKKPAFWRRKCAATGDYIMTAEQAAKVGLFDAVIFHPTETDA